MLAGTTARVNHRGQKRVYAKGPHPGAAPTPVILDLGLPEKGAISE